MKQIFIALGVVTVFIGALATGYGFSWYMFSIAPQENTERVQRVVMAVCSHSTTIGNYDTCRAAEDASQLTYKCTKDTCWTQEN